MKRLLQVLCVLTLTLSLNAQDHIEFRKDGWDQALKDAKAMNKIIFVDAYTTWCGPCKWMSKNVFPQKDVADFYNESFINMKLDMEKGEGLKFAKDYQVRAYPTLLYIDGDGEVVHKSLGSRDAEKFIELGHAALDPETNLKGLKTKYNKGVRSADFLKSYTKTLLMANMDASTIANEYFNGQKDWNTEENRELVFELSGYDLDNKYFQYMLNNRAVYEEAYPEMFDQKLDAAIGGALGRNATLESTTEMYKQYYPDSWEQKVASLTLRKKMYSDDPATREEFLEGSVAYIDKYQISDWSFLNSMAWRVYEISDNPKYLMEAKNWALKSIQGQSNFYNNDTVAALYYKLKQKHEALHFAMMAVELAKADGADYSETSKLIEKIKAL